MLKNAALPTALASSGDCSVSGLDFATITGITWRGYLTQTRIGDKGKVNVKSITQVALKAKAGAASGDFVKRGRRDRRLGRRGNRRRDGGRHVPLHGDLDVGRDHHVGPREPERTEARGEAPGLRPLRFWRG
jgi:hypothetical protein